MTDKRNTTLSDDDAVLELTQPLVYDYTASEAYCRSIGGRWLPEWLPTVDKAFAEAGMTQEQVGRCMRLYLWHVRYLFNPKTYTFWQRVALALFFLRGK